MESLPQHRGSPERAPELEAEPIGLSLVAPVFNEEGNLRPLYEQVAGVFGDERWELILVDDGSTDASPEVIRELARLDRRVRGALFEHNCGQTAATAIGIRMARGSLVATLDADLQNDPADLPAMIEKLGEWDAVVGYRTERKDDFVRRASAKIANAIRNRLSGDQIRDTGCSLKLFRAETIAAIPLFEGMHRFLPTLLRYHGYRVLEHPVSHRPRVSGQSKYGISNRAWRAFKDLIAVCWMRGRVIRPRVREFVGSEVGIGRPECSGR